MVQFYYWQQVINHDFTRTLIDDYVYPQQNQRFNPIRQNTHRLNWHPSGSLLCSFACRLLLIADPHSIPSQSSFAFDSSLSGIRFEMSSPEEKQKDQPPKETSFFKRNFLKKILPFLFSHVGLVILNVTYLSLGAVIFMQLESYQDTRMDYIQSKTLNASKRIDAARQYLIDRVIVNVGSRDFSEEVIKKWLDDYQVILGNEIQDPDTNYKGSITEANITVSNRWSFGSVMLFVLSITSTIGLI